MVILYASLCKLLRVWGAETPGECEGISLSIPQLKNIFLFFLHCLCLGSFFVI